MPFYLLPSGILYNILHTLPCKSVAIGFLRWPPTPGLHRAKHPTSKTNPCSSWKHKVMCPPYLLKEKVLRMVFTWSYFELVKFFLRIAGESSPGGIRKLVPQNSFNAESFLNPFPPRSSNLPTGSEASGRAPQNLLNFLVQVSHWFMFTNLPFPDWFRPYQSL